MTPNRLVHSLSVLIVSSCALSAALHIQGPSLSRSVHDATAASTRAAAAASVTAYAEVCSRMYARSADSAEQMERCVGAFCEQPDEANLARAKEAWKQARRAYCRTEALRFYGGPIDDVEPLLNAWPIDEAYIDCVDGRPACGIVHDVAQFPRIQETVLALANERGGEANVSVGWHAIEFLLWGQDRSATEPGQRPASDFVDGKAEHASRRREYLRTVTSLLARQLRELQRAWAKDADNYRAAFERDPNALRKAMTGALVFTAFELGGERLTVAYDTQDQEQEHSCFSDTSCSDLVEGHAGLVALLRGTLDGERVGPGLIAAIAAADAECAAMLERRLDAAAAAIAAIPHPFDQAILGKDDAPGRVALRAAIEALEAQAEALAFAGNLLGYELPVRPGN